VTQQAQAKAQKELRDARDLLAEAEEALIVRSSGFTQHSQHSVAAKDEGLKLNSIATLRNYNDTHAPRLEQYVLPCNPGSAAAAAAAPAGITLTPIEPLLHRINMNASAAALNVEKLQSNGPAAMRTFTNDRKKWVAENRATDSELSAMLFRGGWGEGGELEHEFLTLYGDAHQRAQATMSDGTASWVSAEHSVSANRFRDLHATMSDATRNVARATLMRARKRAWIEAGSKHTD